MNEIATAFERRVLYGFGRHLWNVSGIIGVISFLVGLLLFASSNAFTKEVKVYEGWLKEYKSNDATESAEIADILDYINPARAEERLEAKQRCIAQWQYSNAEYYCSKANELSEEKQAAISRFESLYENYKADIEAKNAQEAKDAEARKESGRLSLLFGLSAIASSSAISAVLSIERNTRKD